jgi:hypothetical protein
LTPPPPVPATREELFDPAWLSAALGLRHPGIEVTGFTLGPEVSRLSTNARFTIECAGGVPEGMSPHLCAKGYFSEIGQTVAYLGEAEARFYGMVAEPSGVRTLRCHYADVHPETRHGVIITEDAVAAGATFLDALSETSVERTAASLEQLALLHARTWDSPALAHQSWLDWRLPDYPKLRGAPDIQGNFDGVVGTGVPEEVRDAPRVVAGLKALADRNPANGHWCVLHGDAHCGNLIVDVDGLPGLVDWQVVQRGQWGIDVGYHVASSLQPGERSLNERDLLAHYLDHLGRNGVEAPGWDEAWSEYRKGIMYGYYMWAVTLLVDIEITTELVHRLSTAVAELDSFGALGV